MNRRILSSLFALSRRTASSSSTAAWPSLSAPPSSIASYTRQLTSSTSQLGPSFCLQDDARPRPRPPTCSSAIQFEQRRGAATKGAAVRRLARVNQRAQSPATRRSQPPLPVAPKETNPETAAVSSVVGHSALIITRPVEWGTVLLGYEQANKYEVYDEEGQVVALLAEEEGSVGRFIGRQILRTRRPFTATVFAPSGDQVIFRLRRPAYLISSTIYIEDAEGERVGEVQQRWHPWRRRYELFLGTQQFAAIDGGFLAWEFELKDESGGTLALIDRNFSGFGKEMFTDAGKYVIHFGSQPMEAAKQLQTSIQAAHPDRPAPPVTALAKARTDVAVIPTSTGNQLLVKQALQLESRMVALAAAISIDYDYFSRHSHGHGIMSPFMPVPMLPFPGGGGGGGGEGVEGAEGSTAGDAGGAGAGASSGGGDGGSSAAGGDGSSGSGEPLERDLGGDEWFGGDNNNSSSGDSGSGDSGGGFWGGGGDSGGGGGGDEGGGMGLGDVLDAFGWGSDD